MAHVTIKQALQRVADNPTPDTDVALQVPAHELVCRSLFEIANNPDAKVRGSMARANRARKLIFDRLVGKRKPGTHPATKNVVQVDFVDLTSYQLEKGDSDG